MECWGASRRRAEKPNPLTLFPAREGGTSGSPLRVGEGSGERFLHPLLDELNEALAG